MTQSGNISSHGGGGGGLVAPSAFLPNLHSLNLP